MNWTEKSEKPPLLLTKNRKPKTKLEKTRKPRNSKTENPQFLSEKKRITEPRIG